MTALVILLGFVALCVLAASFGTDSRFDRPGRQL
jgi:hypothetical protein